MRSVGWLRLGVVVALIAALTAGALLSPVGAGPSANRKFVRKLVGQRINALRQDLGQRIRDAHMNAISIQRVGPLQLTGSATDLAVATLPIPNAGNYVVTAKLWWNVENSTSTGIGGEIDCDLLALDSFDTSRESGVTDFDYGTLSLQLARSFPGPATVVLRCRDEFQGGNPVEVHNVVATATEVFALASTRIGRSASSDPPPARTRP